MALENDCGNASCGHGCCCYCKKEGECYECRNRTPYSHRETNCEYQRHHEIYICFDCKRTWKNNVKRFEDNNRDPPDKYGIRWVTKTEGWPNCAQCNGEAIRISHVVRVPKKKDKAGWKLLKKLILLDDLEDCKKGTLGHFFYHKGGIGCTLHMRRREASQFWVPTKKNQYDDWLKYMKETKFKNVDLLEHTDWIKGCRIQIYKHIIPDLGNIVLEYLDRK